MLQHRSIAQETGVNENWPGVLDEYGVQFLVLDIHRDSELLRLFHLQPGWTLDYQDGDVGIFARTGTVGFAHSAHS